MKKFKLLYATAMLALTAFPTIAIAQNVTLDTTGASQVFGIKGNVVGTWTNDASGLNLQTHLAAPSISASGVASVGLLSIGGSQNLDASSAAMVLSLQHMPDCTSDQALTKTGKTTFSCVTVSSGSTTTTTSSDTPFSFTNFPAIFVDATKDPSVQGWTDTGVNVPGGSLLIINANGFWSNSCCSEDRLFSADGWTGNRQSAYSLSAPLPEANVGALVGKIGTNGAIFLVGHSMMMPNAASGELYLAMNDSYGGYYNNMNGFNSSTYSAPKLTATIAVGH
jgi:hypothetical protein